MILFVGGIQEFNFRHAKLNVFPSKWKYHIGSWDTSLGVRKNLGFGDNLNGVQSQGLDKITRNMSGDSRRRKPCTKNWGTSIVSGYRKGELAKNVTYYHVY